MAELPKISERARGLIKFDPKNGLKRDAQADAIIAFAKRVKDWPTLDKAIKQKIADQQEFLDWWREKVTPGGRGGDRKSKNHVPRSADVIPMRQAEKETGITNQTVSKWGQRLADVEKYAADLWGIEYSHAFPDAPDANIRGSKGTGVEWYTPPQYIELAREVMGEIDLDPASNKQAQKTIQAKQFYTKADNGLDKPWRGRVWLNPPYMQPDISNFMDKMVEEVRLENTSQAIMLTHNYTDTTWFHAGVSVAAAICFTRGRISFMNADRSTAGPPTCGQAFFYFGPGTKAFHKIFSSVGFVVTR